MPVHTHHLPRLAATLVVLLSCLNTKTTAAEPRMLAPTVVVATRYVQPAAQATASVTVLDADDLAADAALSAETILAHHAGVTFARTGGSGQQVSLFLRGSESDSTLVLVDGININGGTLGGAALQNLRGADIERIEIVRGPRSSLYGSEAIGGVISITTRRAKESERVALSFSGGSDNTAEARVSASRDFGSTQLAASAGQLRTDGTPVTTRTAITGAHDNTSATLSLITKAGDTRVTFNSWATRGSTRYVGCDYDAMLNCTGISARHQDFSNGVIGLGSETAFGSKNTLRLRAGQAMDELQQIENTDFADTRRLSGGAEWQNRSGGNTLVAGIDAEMETVSARSYGTALDAVNDNRAVFLRNDLQRDTQQFALGLRNTVYDSFGEHWTGDASYGLHAAKNTFAWIAHGRGFRAPDSSERFGSGGNPALKPETTHNSELGVRQQAGAHEFTVTGFVQHIERMIDYRAPTYVATNIAQARITGTEFGWRWRNEATRLDAFISWLDAVDDSTGTRLSRRPDQQVSASAQHRIGSVTLRASLLAMEQRDNSPYDAIVLPRFVTADAGIHWAASKHLELDARVENISNARYVLAGNAPYAAIVIDDVANYRMPDRGVFVGVEWKQ
jgi:vitamin B12 transporter